jgi:hypothetical protein
MENIQQFMPAWIEKRYYNNIQAFNLSCIYKDICLQNYKYKPRLNICNQVIHEWEHSYKEKTITVDIIRQILVYDLFNELSEMQNQYLSESQHYEANDENHEKFQRYVKYIAGICCWLKTNANTEILFKEFIDNYRLGYFN